MKKKLQIEIIVALVLGASVICALFFSFWLLGTVATTAAISPQSPGPRGCRNLPVNITLVGATSSTPLTRHLTQVHWAA